MAQEDVADLMADGEPLPVGMMPAVDADEFVLNAHEGGKFVRDSVEANHGVSKPLSQLRNGNGSTQGPLFRTKGLESSSRRFTRVSDSRYSVVSTQPTGLPHWQ